MRSTLKDQLVGLDPDFRHRGLNQTRIETFSDAVFAVAFTLVVLSMDVPDTFDELRASINDIIPSFICIILIVVIWYQHYIFFLRYGLQDIKTVTINTFLTFLVLIYVYPLKFLARFLVELYGGWILGKSDNYMDEFGGEMNSANMDLLMTAYGLGAALIFMTMSWLYRHCLKNKEELDLNEYETFVTKTGMWTNLLMSSIPFLSFLVIWLNIFGHGAANYAIGGFVYMLYPPVMITYGQIMRKKQRARFG